MRSILVAFTLTVTQLLPFSASAAQVTNISEHPEQVAPLLPGLTAPTLTLQDNNAQAVDLAKLYQDKTTVLVVYRGGWCPYCSRQLAGLQKIERQIVELGAQIVAVSPDSPQALSKSSISSPNYRLLSDDQLALTQALGLAYYLDDKTAKAYRDRMGVQFVDLDGKSRVALPVPAVFVIDKAGLVQFQYANPNYKVRLEESVLLAAVRAASNLK
ncbi:peroxiredoxin-like family protein [Pseudoalteromonas sp. OOF1S-7]|uniref:peroxiredoxin-like family protein n=1 Tax=Pseudoalteromonas sp. OOF1S-7 TaxID=2917757 RepID=UPI001EF6B1B0|nr:peroxiredoxin-like family protein [Pseudoalteromonas sp. OOF1S-7]MCG7537627.1 AhpC/TSA family protein [Pseudoalteromonas sp. OOF1S-7]